MATPKLERTREERALEIPFENITQTDDGWFSVSHKGKVYLTDGVNCECGDSRFGRNDCIHCIRARQFNAMPVPQIAKVVNIAEYR
jgi:hypothetical protein